MAKREKIVTEKNSYFTGEKENLQFFSTGCTLLDCAIGGGIVLGRMTNIVGDKSTAKTGLATECLINFTRKYPEGNAAYREVEAAWDPGYAGAMGLPLDKIDFGDPDKPLQTVEEFAKDLEAFVDKCIKADKPGLYVLDSLDALSDDAEMEQDFGAATYGMAKAKLLSIMFRKLTRKIERSKVNLLIISQVRDNINAVAFGEKQKRSGGKAMDFYASQVVWLAHIKALKKTIKKVERVYGITIRAKVKKNKVGMSFREAEFDFLFGFGVDDHGASVHWLKEIGRLGDIDVKDTEFKAYLQEVAEMDDAAFKAEVKAVSDTVKRVWAEVENTFIPVRKKYA